jgi:SnoaL-like domain
MELDGFALHVHLRREVEPVKPPKQELLKAAYAAFNCRDLETALALLHPEVEWANGLEGGTVHGPEAVRAYWTRQWGLIDPQAEPLGFEEQKPIVWLLKFIRWYAICRERCSRIG